MADPSERVNVRVLAFDFRAANETAVSRIGRSAASSSRLLSVGAAPLFAANVLPLAIQEFRSHRPDLHIQLVDCAPAAIVPLVQSGKIDMGLRVLYKPTPGLRRLPCFASA